MTVTVSVVGIVILIFVLHTIVTHLLNWMFRKALEDETGMMLFFTVFLTVVELVICTNLLINYVG